MECCAVSLANTNLPWPFEYQWMPSLLAVDLQAARLLDYKSSRSYDPLSIKSISRR